MTQLVPYAFQNAAGSAPLSRLDDNFNYVSGKWVSVKDADYGAKGDGATDDATAINNALSLSPSGSTIVIPPGQYRIGSTLTVPADKRLVALGYARAASSGGVVFVADLAVTPVVKLDGGGGSAATALKGVFISRVAGTVPANSIGVLVQSSNASLLEDVNVYRADIAYKYASDAVNSKMERCETATISGTHLWLEGYGLMAHSCRFGKDGGADVNGNEYVRIKGGGDTYYFSQCHFNLSANRVTRYLYFDTYSSPNGIISFEQSHFELGNAGVASTGTSSVSRLGFHDCTIDVGGAEFFNSIPSGMLSNFTMIGCHLHGTFTHTGHAHSRIVGNHFTDNVVLDACSGAFSANNLAANFTIQGACTGLKAGGNNFLSSGATITYSATGDWSATGNTKTGRAEWNDAFVPVLSVNSGALGAGSSASMSYTLSGNRLHFYARISVPNVGTAAGNIGFTLPLAPVNNVAIASGIESSLSGKAVQGVYNAGRSAITVVDYAGNFPTGSGGILELNGHFEIAP